MSAKIIYEFPVGKKVKKEVVEESGDTKITRTIDAIEEVAIVLKRPSRTEGELIDFEYAKEHSAAMRAGVFTKTMVHKLLEDQGLIQKYKESTEDKANRMQAIELEFQELYVKEDKSDDDKLRIDELEQEWERLARSLQEAGLSLESAFQNTAESRAEKKAVMYLTLLCTYTKDASGNLKPFFRGDNLENKLKHYDALMDTEDEFVLEVSSKAGYLISLWYLNKAQSKEDFDKILNINPDKEVEEAVEEPVAEPVSG